MLVVKVELWPHGRRAQARELGRIGIANVGGYEVCDYVAVLSDDTGRRATAMLYDHRRSDRFWPLVVRAAGLASVDDEFAAGVDQGARQLAARMFELIRDDSADPNR